MCASHFAGLSCRHDGLEGIARRNAEQRVIRPEGWCGHAAHDQHGGVRQIHRLMEGKTVARRCLRS